MKKFIIDFFNNFKNKGLKHKIFVISLTVLYIFIICVCAIQVECEFTSPGTCTRVSNVIEIDNEENKVDNTRIYTVSVYTKTKMSLAQFFIAKYLDSNIDVMRYDHDDDVFTINESYKMDACAKNQSIQDSIIVAYEYAKKENYDVNLVYSYSGVVTSIIPANYYKTGPESLMIGDLVKSIGGVEITSMNVFREIIEEIYLDYKNNVEISVPEIKVIRQNKEVTLSACNIKILAYLGSISYDARVNNQKVNNYYFYDYYTIDYIRSKPSIEIQNINTVGPSGGLMQAIYVYNAITGGNLVKDKYIVGTGTISSDGSVGAIGGIKQKVVTASIYLTDYFFVDAYDYDEALKQYESLKNPSFKLVKVEEFKDAINVLKEDLGE